MNKSRKPMTANEARDIVSLMRVDTPKPARIRLMQLAIEGGNLSNDAKSVYREAIIAETKGE